MIEKYINKIIQGHVLSVLKILPDESIDMIMTSPPFWALRDYQTEGQIWDGDKNCKHEWQGSSVEHDNLRFRGKTSEVDNNKNENIYSSKKNSSGGFCVKCNAWLVSLGLEPTFNLYIKHLCDIFDEGKRVLKKEGTLWVNLGDTYSTSGCGGQPNKESKNWKSTAKPRRKAGNLPDKCLCQIPARFSIEMCNRGWILRNDIIWEKDNCMPSSASDRFTVDYEHLFFFSKQTKYYFEQQFEKAKMNRWGGNKFQLKPDYKYKNKAAIRIRDRNDMMPEKRNKRCVWTINTKPYKEAHFAVFPEKLCETPIKASCPKDGIVLDPFMGSGTTASVALKLGRKFIGIELNPEYIKIAERRLSQKYFEF